MFMFKKFTLWSATQLFTFSVFCLITIGSLTVLARPGYLKSWGKGSGAYQKLPEALVDQAAKEQSKEQGSGDGLSFKDQNVQNAAKQAVNPVFIQKSAEQIIDGSFSWLDKKTEKPTFTIDVLSVKQDFVDNLGTHLRERYQALPTCAEGVVPNTTDPLTIDCRPDEEMLDIEQVIDNQKLSLLENKDFLPETTLSADSLGSDSDSNNVFEEKSVPMAYGVFRLAPAIFAGLALLSGVLVIILCEVKKFGVRKLGWRFVVAGLLALIATIIGLVALTEVRNLALNQGAKSGITPYKDVIAALITAARNDVAKLSGVLSIGSMVFGGIILFFTRDVARRTLTGKKKAQKEVPTPTEKPELEEKPGSQKEVSKTEDTKPPEAPTTVAAAELQPKPRPLKKTLIQ